MSWMSDLGSVLGIPAGATLAAAIYTACISAEKIARPQALREISRNLKEPLWISSTQGNAVVVRLFKWTFGDRHLSLKCIRRSFLATIFFSAAIMLEYYFRTGKSVLQIIRVRHQDEAIRNVEIVLYDFIFSGVIPDYLALYKSRVLLSRISSLPRSLVLLINDILLSIFISFLFRVISQSVPMVFGWFGVNPVGPYYAVKFAIDYIPVNIRAFFFPVHAYPIFSIFFMSTLFTSIWTASVLSSIVAIRIFAPVNSFTIWFFDVENHPLQAIGVVAGALVMLGALAVSVTRIVIE